MEAMVNEAPTSRIPPNSRPQAASATPSGSSRAGRRAGLRNTSSSVAAITSNAAINSTTIECESWFVSPESTTGTPVTV